MELRDRVIVVTGASSGIGRATSKHLADLGAKVVLASRDANKLGELAASLPDSLPVPSDVTNVEEAQQLVETAVETLGRIDVLINCAGQAMYAPVERVDLSQYRALIDLNVVAPLNLMQLVIPIMRAQGGGTILNVSSMASRRYIPNIAGYSSTKYALNALTLTAREELAEDNITVSLIRPGIVDTGFGDHATSPEPEALRRAPDGGLLPHVLSAETVAEKIGELIQSGEAEVDLPGAA